MLLGFTMIAFSPLGFYFSLLTFSDPFLGGAFFLYIATRVAS